MKGTPLEALNSASYRMLGTPRLLRRSALVIVFCFILLIGLLVFLPWQQTAVGDGRVIAFAPGERVQSITSNIDGRVEKWFAREGDKVQEGDLLARMADNDPDIIDRLKSERDALVREIRALELSVEMSANNRERQRALLKKEFSTQTALEQAKIAEARAQKDLADAEGRLAKLDTNIARQLMQDIRAPRAGVVQSILVGENSGLIKSGAAIAQLVPLTKERTVELFLNGLDLPFIRIGQEVRLQFEGWPILQFSGLPELSTGTFRGVIKIIDPSDDGQGNFRVVVAQAEDSPWPEPELLRQGVRARGWVQMNRVPLWFEIWRLINDLPPFPVPLSNAQGTAQQNGSNGTTSTTE
jgi:multidrug efflux pump subunit AcrA (membrane-fusion protein)